MSEIASPSLEEWKSLYAAAGKFQKLAPWRWMTDDMVFGVQDPETGSTGYCCILGALGQVFALNVYIGGRGLATYMDLAMGRIRDDSVEVMNAQECLHASFEDKSFLDERDLRVIRQLGLAIHGIAGWPQFRDYTPGFLPWYITSSQSRTLVHTLREAGNVALRCKEDPLLLPERDGLFLVRVPRKAGRSLKWSDETRPEEPPPSQTQISALPDARAMDRLRRIGVSGNTLWEIDLGYSPGVVDSHPDQRPYYPRLLICLDSSGRAVGHQLFSGRLEPAEIQKRVLGTFQKANIVPARILVKRKEVYDLLRPIASPLAIVLQMVDSLPVTENFYEEMFDYMTDDRPGKGRM